MKKKKAGYSNCTYFNHAIQKYGWENIEHEIILEGVSKDHAVYAEKYLIKWYKNMNMCYNLTDGGEGISGTKRSEETKRKISRSNKGKNLGKVRSPETRKLLSEIFSKPIQQLDKNTLEIIAEYPSAKQTAIKIGHPGHESNIAHVLHGRCISAFGYVWRFKPVEK